MSTRRQRIIYLTRRANEHAQRRSLVLAERNRLLREEWSEVGKAPDRPDGLTYGRMEGHLQGAMTATNIRRVIESVFQRQ